MILAWRNPFCVRANVDMVSPPSRPQACHDLVILVVALVSDGCAMCWLLVAVGFGGLVRSDPEVLLSALQCAGDAGGLRGSLA